MNIRLKALGVLVAVIAIGVVGAASASATTGGHFTSEVSHTTLSGSASGGHTTEIKAYEQIQCASASYSGTISTATATELTLTPTYSTCKTKEGESTTPIHANGCSLTFKIGKKANSDNTTQLSCPAGKSLEVTHPNCTVTVVPQALPGGSAYTAVTESGKAAITVDLTIEMPVQYHGGICIFLGTNQTGALSGSFVLTGKDTADSLVGIDSTGSEAAQFRYENSHMALTGTQTTASKATFGVLLGSVECSSATLDGTVTGTSGSQITVKPAYSGCSGSGREFTTHVNGCAYVLTVSESSTNGTVHIECPAGKSIETTIDKFPEGCTLTIPAQTAGGVVDYKEEGAGTGRDLLLTWTLEGLDYTRDGCEVGGTGNNGTMSGSITLSGEDTSGNPKGIWIE